MHEAQLHKKNSFVTLTYDNKRLKPGGAAADGAPPIPGRDASPNNTAKEQNQRAKTESGSHVVTSAVAAALSKRDLQLFLKRLRKQHPAKTAGSIKYYACGEYGDRLGRPHYHIALFGEDFSKDRYYWRTAPSGHKQYRSAALEKLWKLGHAEIGELTFESAAYVARYVTKKITGRPADEHYRRTDELGRDYWLQPEFALMSRGGRGRQGGIARTWFDKFARDVYPHDYVVIHGQKLKPPRYYDDLHGRRHPESLLRIKAAREQQAAAQAHDSTPARLATKETVQLARLKLKKRALEHP